MDTHVQHETDPGSSSGGGSSGDEADRSSAAGNSEESTRAGTAPTGEVSLDPGEDSLSEAESLATTPPIPGATGDSFVHHDRRDRMTSTPVVERGRPTFRASPLAPRGPRLTARDWSFMPGRRNRRRRRNLMRRINYTDEGEVTLLEEINKKATGLRWKARRAKTLKFVDDGMFLTKINMDSAAVTVGQPGEKPTKDKLDLQSQNLFRRVVRKAESRGMVVNNRKTKILCISDAQSYKAKSHLVDSEGNVLTSGNRMKVLGFHMDSRPSVHAHVEAMKIRMRDRVWVLRHLRVAGFTQDELATVYRTVILPVLDYCAVIYHPMLNDDQDQQVERLQAQALKSIYGYKDSYRTMREKACVTTHRARRIALCDKFAEKAAANPRFEAWFPLRTGRSGRHGERYQELQARTDRLLNTPLFYYRRRLNGKEGKSYGMRNREYREETGQGKTDGAPGGGRRRK